MLARTVGKPVEQRGQLLDHLGVERSEASAELRTAERRDADLLEEHAAVAIGGDLEKQEVESALERLLRIEHVELRLDGVARVLDHLIDGRNQQVFLRLEVVMDEPRREPRLGCDALHRRASEAMFDDRFAQPVDDLPAARLRKTRTSHRVNWLADQPINVNSNSSAIRRGRRRWGTVGPWARAEDLAGRGPVGIVPYVALPSAYARSNARAGGSPAARPGRHPRLISRSAHLALRKEEVDL